MDLEAAVKLLVSVRADMKQLKQMEKEAKEVINEHLSLGATPVGEYVVNITETSRWDETTAIRNLDPKVLKSISKLKPDMTLAKAFIDPETYKIACCNQSRTISIKGA